MMAKLDRTDPIDRSTRPAEAMKRSNGPLPSVPAHHLPTTGRHEYPGEAVTSNVFPEILRQIIKIRRDRKYLSFGCTWHPLLSNLNYLNTFRQYGE
jgi:hypothetical protein